MMIELRLSQDEARELRFVLGDPEFRSDLHRVKKKLEAAIDRADQPARVRLGVEHRAQVERVIKQQFG